MKIDGMEMHAYGVVTGSGVLVGFDERPLDEVEAEWLSKMKLSSKREAEHVRRTVIANMKNHKLDHCDDAGIPRDEVDYSEVSPPPMCSIEEDELLRLRGVPTRGGFGAVTVPAESVRGISTFVTGVFQPLVARGAVIQLEAPGILERLDGPTVVAPVPSTDGSPEVAT